MTQRNLWQTAIYCAVRQSALMADLLADRLRLADVPDSQQPREWRIFAEANSQLQSVLSALDNARLAPDADTLAHLTHSDLPLLIHRRRRSQ